uniref:Uncharacterized protein n=1 Tax=Chrysotila carterae TaxID=13221 RepID=A0A7S4ESQ9_CHRCT|eukprot:6204280-Pleurochrysis_carterae.AAC.4
MKLPHDCSGRLASAKQDGAEPSLVEDYVETAGPLGGQTRRVVHKPLARATVCAPAVRVKSSAHLEARLLKINIGHVMPPLCQQRSQCGRPTTDVQDTLRSRQPSIIPACRVKTL